MKRTLQIANGIALIATVFINYLSNTGAINGTTIGKVSNELNTLITPSGYAFSIWGLIYMLLIGFIFYQGRSLYSSNKSSDDVVLKIGWWFVISCIANIAWIFSWLYGETGLSSWFILLLLFSIMQIIFRCRMELDDEPFSRILFVSWPFVFYAGWITVASIVNIAAFLVKIKWNGAGITPETWTIFLIILATAINIRAIYSRNLREFAIVGAWALIAISYKNYESNEVISYTALLSAVVLLINCAYHAVSQYRKSILAKNFTEKR